MSSTTLVEFTDTQMLDYATDADFSMQNSPADWLAVEATMLDDNPTSATTEYSETIEIDMEHNDEHDEEITEYEMADDVIVDVDYDGDAQFQDAELDEPPIVMDSVLLSNDPNAHQHEPTQTHFALQPTELGDLSVTMAEVPSFQDAADEAAPVHTEEPTSTALHLVDGDSTLSAIPEAATSFPPATHSPVLSEEPPPFVVSVAASSDGPSYDHEAAEEIFSRANEFAEHEAAADGQGTIAAPHKGQHEESEEPLDGAPGLEGRAESFDHPGGQYAAPAEAAEFPGVEAGEDVDPHEISEGVYIDPPPAVLLSLSFTEPASLCLFNHPPSSSRSQSPGEPSTTNSAVTLILQQQPTLYYEPLNHVFAALRHEQVIYNLPQLVDNELIFEAYDMNLVIGEHS
ncbi:hypothetical protein BC835DRAFT_1060887 [Cytidiella melzeri]|nr:hypothetical protein BC835DRAFT_1060887 [Cytidiella melzeri]